MTKKLDHQIMDGNDNKLPILFQKYSSLEKEIQKRTKEISEHFCKECPSKCCKEEMCRESIESKFLYILTEKQNVDYDRQKGWIGPSGCRLNYGRPLVCYEFFCERILSNNNFRASNIQQIIKEFISIGNRAYGNTHLICIDNLKTISRKKIVKINSKIGGLINKLANDSMQTGPII
jgi:hypothetical protein